jgi:hypothetical protein
MTNLFFGLIVQLCTWTTKLFSLLQTTTSYVAGDVTFTLLSSLILSVISCLILLSFPSNGTAWFQPLDRNFYGPMKSNLASEVAGLIWDKNTLDKIRDRNTIDRGEIAECVAKAFVKTQSNPVIIAASFSTTGYSCLFWFSSFLFLLVYLFLQVFFH